MVKGIRPSKSLRDSSNRPRSRASWVWTGAGFSLVRDAWKRLTSVARKKRQRVQVKSAATFHDRGVVTGHETAGATSSQCHVERGCCRRVAWPHDNVTQAKCSSHGLESTCYERHTAGR